MKYRIGYTPCDYDHERQLAIIGPHPIYNSVPFPACLLHPIKAWRYLHGRPTPTPEGA